MGTRDRQTAQTRENPQAEINHNRDDSDYEWEELQVAQFSGEDENLLRMWEGLLDESRACRIWVKKSIIEILEKFNNYILEVERHPEEIKIKKKKTKGELYEMEHEVDWLKNRAHEFINEDTEIPFCWLLDRLDNTKILLGIARHKIDTAAIAGSKPNITFGKYELTEIQEDHTEMQLVTQGDMFRGGMPGEPFQRELMSRLIDNGDNNRLSEDLMHTMLNPHYNRIIQDDTQEAHHITSIAKGNHSLNLVWFK